jgi:hypothetical protein
MNSSPPPPPPNPKTNHKATFSETTPTMQKREKTQQKGLHPTSSKGTPNPKIVG